MALKAKTQPVQAETEVAEPVESRAYRTNVQVDQNLTRFMEANQKTTDHFRKLVKEDPERAVRTIMLGKMNKHDDQMRLVQKQLPQVKQWVDQTPGMKEKIEERIKDVNPIYREKAYVNEAMKAKARLDFSPMQGIRTSVSG